MTDMTEDQFAEYTLWLGKLGCHAGHEALTQLEALRALGLLSPKVVEYCDSVAKQFAKKNKLSPMQWYWVVKHLHQYSFQQKPAEPQEALQVGNLQGLVDLFHKAKANLKTPAIVVLADTPEYGEGHTEVKIYPAPTWGKNPGLLYLRANTKGDDYFGKVTPEGQFVPQYAIKNTPLSMALANMLQGMSADPAGAAAAHGKLTGKCCFCNSGLTDQKSTDVGYGPTCAQKWGLLWGGKVVGLATGTLKSGLPSFQQIKPNVLKLATGEALPLLPVPDALLNSLKNSKSFLDLPWDKLTLVVIQLPVAGGNWAEYVDTVHTPYAHLSADPGGKVMTLAGVKYRALSWGTLDQNINKGQQWILLRPVDLQDAKPEPVAIQEPRAARTYSLDDSGIQFGATLALLQGTGS